MLELIACSCAGSAHGVLHEGSSTMIQRSRLRRGLMIQRCNNAFVLLLMADCNTLAGSEDKCLAELSCNFCSSKAVSLLRSFWVLSAVAPAL